MPPQDGLRLNNLGEIEQAWHEPRHPYQQGPVASPKGNTTRCAPENNIELMPQEEVLDFKPPP
jgi:hypothetical protein